MSTSPFMTPSNRRRRREIASRRRRRRRGLLAVVVALALAAVVVVMAFAGPGTAHESTAASSRHRSRGHADTTTASATTSATATASSPTAARSPIGLPLGKPALALTGISDPAEDPVHPSFPEPPHAGILFNLDTGQVLWQHNAYARLRIASLTKMMTALLTVTSAPPNAPVLITKEAVDMPGSKVGVLPLGKHVKLESLLYGLLLPSGNDAAVALAQHVAGSVNQFVARMNVEAAKLGMGCTHYSSPSGYYDQYNFSCAADLALLAHVDLEQPRIASVVRTYSAVLPFPIKGGKLYLYNNNPLLIYKYPGVTGMKTGETEAAGRCLVATAERHGVRLGVVLLHSPDPGTQAAYLLNRGFEGVYHQAPVPQVPPIPPDA
jgi:serine-type D-Ala-D-Ala carboxypeptidase (penicillin-binding protein 5/6)